MTKPQMMICPKAKECKKCPNPHHKYPHELIVAGYSDACDDLRGGCPACIPVEPEPKWDIKCKCGHYANDHKFTNGCCLLEDCDCKIFKKVVETEPCPDCNGTGINPEKFPDARCPCTYKDADLQPEKHCPKPICDTCENTSTCTIKQAPQMPLIEVIDRTGLNIAHKQSCLCHVCRRLRTQRDADMAWHNEKVQQVRKEFAEKFAKWLIDECTGLRLTNLEDLSEVEIPLSTILAHIRAMAEKKQLEYDPDRSKAHNSGRFQQRR